MKPIIVTLAALSLLCPTRWRRRVGSSSRAPLHGRASGAGGNFAGTVRVQPLFDTTATTRAYSSSVAFEAGARTAWHTHPRGQVLIVTAGTGRVQRWGGSVR